MADGKWSAMYTAMILVILAIIVGAGIGVSRTYITNGFYLLMDWLGTLVLMFIMAIIIGYGKTGLKQGILIDHRNKMSLSRLQMVLWTFVVISAFVVMALWRLASLDKPLDIAIPQQLWIALGISTTSLIGSPLIKDFKEKKNADGGQGQKNAELSTAKSIAIKRTDDAEKIKTINAQDRIGEINKEARIFNVGLVIHNEKAEDASFADIFSGEDTDDAARVDLGKVQMFYFTVLLVVVYSVLLATNILGKSFVFPSIDENSSMAALLALSNGGYLIKKAT